MGGGHNINQEPFYDPGEDYHFFCQNGPFGESGVGISNRVSGLERVPQYSILYCPINTPFSIPTGPLVNRRLVKLCSTLALIYRSTRRYVLVVLHLTLGTRPPGAGRRRLALRGEVLNTKADYAGPLNVTNSFGVPSFDPVLWQMDMADVAVHAGPDQAVIGSFQGPYEMRQAQ